MQKDYILESLKEFGLSDKEALFYFHAVKMDTFTIGSIAKVSRIKRPTCYLLVDKLIEKGLIVEIPGIRKKKFKTIKGDFFLNEAKKNHRKAQDLTEYLQSVETSEDSEPVVKMYQGTNQVRRIFEHILKLAPTDVYYINSVKDVEDAVGASFMSEFIRKRIEKNIWAHGIRIEKEESGKEIYKADAEHKRSISFAPEGFEIKNPIMMYSGYIALIYKEQDYYGLLIKNQRLYESMLSLYHSLEKLSKEKEGA